MGLLKNLLKEIQQQLNCRGFCASRCDTGDAHTVTEEEG